MKTKSTWNNLFYFYNANSIEYPKDWSLFFLFFPDLKTTIALSRLLSGLKYYV